MVNLVYKILVNLTMPQILKAVEEVPMKILHDQVPLKKHYKSGALEHIIMEIPL